MPRISKKANITLWTIQGILALIFLFAGGSKLVLQVEAFQGPIALPSTFIRFIGVCEIAGALGLILPGLLKIRPSLTPLAACGLVAVMTGATVLSAIHIGVLAAIAPFIVGTLAFTVAYVRGFARIAIVPRLVAAAAN